MALVKCAECGHAVSTRAEACPHCGAKPKKAGSIGNALGLLAVIILVISVVGHFSGNDSAPSTAEANNSAQAPPPAETRATVAAPVNFELPLETTSGTLVCPFGAAMDVREGRGLQAAMKSRMEIFRRREDAEKAGCEEWRERLAVRLSEAAASQAKKWKAEHTCGMLEFDAGFIFSCDLRNAPNLPVAVRVEQPLPSPLTPTTLLPAEAKESPPASAVVPGIASTTDESPSTRPEQPESQVEPPATATSMPQ